MVSVGEFLRYVDHRIGDFYPGKWAGTQAAVTAVTPGFDLATPLAKVLPARKRGDEFVMIEYKTDWYGGIAYAKKDPKRQDRRWIHYFGLKVGEEEWLEPQRMCPPDAEPVVVRQGDAWFAAALLQYDGTSCQIRYVGSFDNKEETVNRNRVRAFSFAEQPTAKKGKTR